MEINEMVSVIITTHNRIKLLKKAVESVLLQSYSNIEIVIVNDNSTDNTFDYLNQLQSEHDNIIHIYIGPDETKGGNYARNKGINASKGKYIAFLDDDDEWLAEKIEKQVTLMTERPEYGMVYCNYFTEKNFGERIPTCVENVYIGDVSQLCFQKIFCTTSMIMVRKDLLYKIGMFDESLGFWQEYDLCIRLTEVTKVGCVQEYLMVLRILTNDKQRLTNKYDGWKEAVNRINEKYSERIKKLPKDIKINRELMILAETAIRCDKVGKSSEKRSALFKIWKITKKPKHFVKFILNYPYFLK